MRVAVTGAFGFVGGWLVRELAAHGHEVVTNGPDVTDAAAVAVWLGAERPDAIAHLAAISSPRAAAADPGAALAVNVGGSLAIIEAALALPDRPVVLVTGSSEVYGVPDRLPIDEGAPLRPGSPYALTKAAAEAIATSAGLQHGLRTVATRSFNHTGPGQSADFAVPAIAARVAAAAAGRSGEIRTGNLDVAREFLDVRDVVIAYRLLLEGAAGGTVPPGTTVNVGSGRSTSIRFIVEALRDLAGTDAPIVVDATLARSGEPDEIRCDPSRLATLTGWAPRIPIERTLADVLVSVVADASA